MKMTSKVEWSRPYVLRRWEHRAARLDEGPSAQDHGLYPPDDEDAGMVTQTHQGPLQQTSCHSPCLRANGKAKSHQRHGRFGTKQVVFRSIAMACIYSPGGEKIGFVEVVELKSVMEMDQHSRNSRTDHKKQRIWTYCFP